MATIGRCDVMCCEETVGHDMMESRLRDPMTRRAKLSYLKDLTGVKIVKQCGITTTYIMAADSYSC